MLSSGARRSISSSNVRLGSSVIAHSSPSMSTPAAAKRSGPRAPRSLPRSSRPSASASRFAGSIVTTATRAPEAASPSRSPRSRRLADAAGTGEDADRLPVEALGELLTGRAPARRRASGSQARRAPAGRGQGPRGRLWPRRSRATCARWRARSRVTVARRCDRTVWRLQCAAVPALKRSGQRFATALDRGPSPVQRRSRSRVSFIGSSSARATATTAVGSGSDSASIVPCRATARSRRRAKVRGAVSTAMPWPVAGASRTTRS